MSNQLPGYLETCSCGASFHANEGSLFDSTDDFWATVEWWREHHRHDMAGVIKPISTTAKGAFGFLGMMEEDDDD